MRTPIQVLLTTLAVLALPAAASANFAPTIPRGESLYSVAAADGLSVAQLAAANGLSTNSQLVTGATLQIPPQTASASTTRAAVQETSAPTSSSSGGYVVQPGDTLSAIAAANGISVDQLAAENGLAPSGILQAGATLAIGGSSPAGSTSASSSAGGTS